MNEKNGIENGDISVSITTPHGAPDTGQDGPEPDGPDSPNAAESGHKGRNRRGQFTPGNPGGPGRGNAMDYSKTIGTGSPGVGGGRSKRPDVDLIAELLLAVQRRGPKFFDELLKASPVAASQLLASLSRNDPAAGAPGGEKIEVHLPSFTPNMYAAITAPQAGTNLADLDHPAALAEIVRLQAQVADLERAANGLPPLTSQEDKPLMAVPSKDAVECFSCKHRTPVKGRMIEPLGVCASCGQTYADSVAMRFTPPAPDPEQRICGDAFVVTAEDRGGWRPVRELSIGGIREAMARPQRGPFD